MGSSYRGLCKCKYHIWDALPLLVMTWEMTSSQVQIPGYFDTILTILAVSHMQIL